MSDVEQVEGATLPLEDVIDEYWLTYRQRVHTLLAWGYADSLLRVQTKRLSERD